MKQKPVAKKKAVKKNDDAPAATSPATTVLWPIERFVPYPKNPRKNDGEPVEKMCASIREFGFKIPILARGDGTIVDGHLRLKAAQKIQLKELPVILCDEWTDAQVQAFRLLVNRSVGWSEWDETLLAVELAEIRDADFDLALTGFDSDEIDSMLAEGSEEGLTEQDEVPEPQAVAITQPGDLWILDKHRLLCGDSTSVNEVERLLDQEAVDIVCADPPYGIDVVGGSKSFGSVGGSNVVAANQYAPILGDDTTATAREFYHCCESLGLTNYILWGGNYFTDFLPPKRCWLVWDKKGRQWDDNFSDFEMAWTSYDVPAKIFTHVWMGIVQSGEREKRVHPTQKPAALIIDCIEHLAPTAELVFDGFGGSGSTLLACEKAQKRALLMELSPIYCDVIVRRWESFTGKTAHLEDGRTFNDIEQESSQTAAHGA